MTEPEHERNIYELVQNTLDFCGNTLEAVQDYCGEHGLNWKDYEKVRFRATKEYPEILMDGGRK